MRKLNTCGIDLLGQRFGRLSVIDGPVTGSRVLGWLCECDCGAKLMVRSSSLRGGCRRSCGCERLDRLRAGKHCLSTTSAYHVWSSMMRRCYMPKTPHYEHYGGRGISVCDRWHDFVNFYEDMGDKPHRKSIERIDVNGNYEPYNCRWATQQEQCRNKRNNKIVEYNGVTETLAWWIDKLSLDNGFVRQRMWSGFTFKEAIEIPKNTTRRQFYARGG